MTLSQVEPTCPRCSGNPVNLRVCVCWSKLTGGVTRTNLRFQRLIRNTIQRCSPTAAAAIKMKTPMFGLASDKHLDRPHLDTFVPVRSNTSQRNVADDRVLMLEQRRCNVLRSNLSTSSTSLSLSLVAALQRATGAPSRPSLVSLFLEHFEKASKGTATAPTKKTE